MTPINNKTKNLLNAPKRDDVLPDSFTLREYSDLVEAGDVNLVAHDLRKGEESSDEDDEVMDIESD